MSLLNEKYHEKQIVITSRTFSHYLCILSTQEENRAGKGSIEITNTKKDATVTPGGSNGGSGTSNGGSDASSHGGSATSRPVKTGDPMNPAFWGLVLLVSVIVIAGGVVVYKKRKQK